MLVVHLLGVFTAPFAFSTRPSPLGQWLSGLYDPYLNFAYLNHGYAFFAPNPGASHLVRYRVTFADEREPVEEEFPDLDRQWPRLLYHRHFMLSEWLHAGFVPPVPPPDIAGDPPARQEWQMRRELYLRVRESYVNRIRTHFQGDEVTIERWEHRPPGFLEVIREGITLSDPRLFRKLPEDRMDEVPPWME